MQQKLVSMFFLDADKEDRSGQREVLGEYLNEGWVVKSITPVGAGVGSAGEFASDRYVAGWALVLLEKS